MAPKQNLQYTAPKVPSFLQKLHAQVNSGHRGASSGGPSSFRNDPDANSEFGQALREEEQDDLAALVGGGPSSGGGAGEGQRHDDVEADSHPSDDEDDWQGAQVVVLKEGKHLTTEEIQRARELERTRVEEDKVAGELGGQAYVRRQSNIILTMVLYSATLNDSSCKAAKAEAASLSKSQISSSIGSVPVKRKRTAVIGGGDDAAESDDDDNDDDETASATQPPPAHQARKGDTLAGAKELIEADRQRKLAEQKRKEKAERVKAKEKERERKNKSAKKEIGKRGKGLSFDFQD